MKLGGFGEFTNILFVVFVFLLPIQTIWMLREVFVSGEKWQYGTIGVYGTDIFLILAFIAVLFSLKLRKRIQIDAILCSALVFLAWALCSTFWAVDSALAFYSATKIALGAVAFMLARSLSAKYVKWAAVALVCMAVLQSAVGIGQFIAQYSPEIKIVGMSEYAPHAAGVSVVKAEGARWLRAYGTLPHPNMLGGYLVVALTASISYFACLPIGKVFRSLRQSKIENRKSYRYWLVYFLFYGSMITLTLGLLLTFSRMAWLGLIGAFFVLIFFAWGQGKDFLAHTVRILGILLVSAVLFTVLIGDVIFPRFDGAIIAREGSVSERVQSLRDGYAVISQYPFIGVGAGNMTAAVRENTPAREIWSLQPAHSVPILMWSELGVVGVGFFGIFLFLIVRNVVRRAQSGVQKASFFGITALITALTPAFFFDHWLWTSHFGILFLFMLLGLTVRKVA